MKPTEPVVSTEHRPSTISTTMEPASSDAASPKPGQLHIPEFTATDVTTIPSIVDARRSTFLTHKTKDVEYRLVQLRKLYWALTDNTALILEALRRDLGLSAYEAQLIELDYVLAELTYMIDNLKKFTKDESVEGIPLHFRAMGYRIRKEPLGVALVLGAYNFPLGLSLLPCIGAIAAGCTFVLKPSESSPATAMVVKALVEMYLDQDSYSVVNGAVPEATALLDQKWDTIFYTGGSAVGKIIAKKAAENLTPTTLELGGLNPAFITRHSDLRLAARRLMWNKSLNSGQVCLSHNYVLVDQTVVDKFVALLQATFAEFFPKGAQASPDFGRIVDRKHFLRMKKLLDDTRGKIVVGGETDEKDLFIAPTAVLVDSPDDILIREETFGPIFSILPYQSLQEAIDTANSVYSTPLALYTFGNKAENEKIMHEVTSGGATMNDGFMHAAVVAAPFGGVGQSGTGRYRGRASFDAFTHRRTIARNPSWMDALLRVRYMPFQKKELDRIHFMTRYTPKFDRSGKPVRGFWPFVLLLGARGAKDPSPIKNFNTVLANP